MTRKEWVNAPKEEKNWSRYNKARKHFPLCKHGKIVVLHHENPFCTNYEEWNVDELVPMFTWCHTHLHNTCYQSEENLQKFLGNRRGKHHTTETRSKMSESAKKRPPPMEEALQKMSRSMKERWLDPEYREKIPVFEHGHTGHVFTEEELKRMSEAHKGQKPPSQKGVIQTDETKKKRSEALKKYYSSPEGLEKRKWFSESRARRGKKREVV